jgi:hypothetical protein
MNRYRLKSEASVAGVQAVSNSFSLRTFRAPSGVSRSRKELLAACSEIIPFKLDLDNSSERTKLLLDAHPHCVGMLIGVASFEQKTICRLTRSRS